MAEVTTVAAVIGSAAGAVGLCYGIYRVRVERFGRNAKTSMGEDAWALVAQLRMKSRMVKTFPERVRTTQHLHFRNRTHQEGELLAHTAVANAYKAFAQDRLAGLLPGDDWERILETQILLQANVLNSPDAERAALPEATR